MTEKARAKEQPIPGQRGRGRPPGARRKRDVKSMLRHYYRDDDYELIWSCLQDIEQVTAPGERAALKIKLLPYAYPKLKEIAIEANVSGTVQHVDATRQELLSWIEADTPALPDATTHQVS